MKKSQCGLSTNFILYCLSSKKKFTLIELLVVITIIAILAGMLLPTLGKIKEVGNKAACLGNMKQVSYASALYTQKYGAFAPYQFIGRASDPKCRRYYTVHGKTFGSTFTDYRQDYWWASLGKVLGWEPHAGCDSSIYEPVKTKDDYAPSIFKCPKVHVKNNTPYNAYQMGYYWDVPEWNNKEATSNPRTFRPSKIKNLSKRAMFHDGLTTWHWISGQGESRTNYLAKATECGSDMLNDYLYGRHNGKENLTFLDGHAESHTNKKIYNEYNGRSSNVNSPMYYNDL